MASMQIGQLSSSLRGARLAGPTASRVGGSSRARVVVVRAAKGKDVLPAAAIVAGLAAAPAARADTVDSAINTAIDLVKATGEAVKAGISAAETGVEYAKTAYDQVAPVVKSAVDVAAPVVSAGVKVASDVAEPALKAAAPTIQAGLSSAQKAVSSSGLDAATKTVVGTTEAAVTTAKPAVEQAVNFLTTTEPVVLGEYALGLLALYYLGPPVLKAGFGALRGYAGEVTPAAALDTLSSGGNAVLVDIRSGREKEQAGLPELPNSNKLIEMEFVSIADRKLRGQLRNAGDLELKITAMQIASLKRLSKGTTLYIMDRNGSMAKAVAKELGKRGFGKAFVIGGGFQAWTNSKLKVKPSSTVYSPEVISPGSVFGTISTLGRRAAPSSRSLGSGVLTVNGRRALPSSTGGR